MWGHHCFIFSCYMCILPSALRLKKPCLTSSPEQTLRRKRRRLASIKKTIFIESLDHEDYFPIHEMSGGGKMYVAAWPTRNDCPVKLLFTTYDMTGSDKGKAIIAHCKWLPMKTLCCKHFARVSFTKSGGGEWYGGVQGVPRILHNPRPLLCGNCKGEIMGKNNVHLILSPSFRHELPGFSGSSACSSGL